jgi:hypothetical protein
MSILWYPPQYQGGSAGDSTTIVVVAGSLLGRSAAGSRTGLVAIVCFSWVLMAVASCR